MILIKIKEMQIGSIRPDRCEDDAEQGKIMAKISEKCNKDIVSEYIIIVQFDVALTAMNAYEYNNVTARRLALAKYTSDSCAWSPRARACMLRTYYAKSGSCHKGVSLLRESRYRTHAP